MNLIKASLKRHKVTIGENEVNLMAYYLCFHFMWLDLVLAEIHGAPCCFAKSRICACCSTLGSVYYTK